MYAVAQSEDPRRNRMVSHESRVDAIQAGACSDRVFRRGQQRRRSPRPIRGRRIHRRGRNAGSARPAGPIAKPGYRRRALELVPGLLVRLQQLQHRRHRFEQGSRHRRLPEAKPFVPARHRRRPARGRRGSRRPPRRLGARSADRGGSAGLQNLHRHVRRPAAAARAPRRGAVQHPGLIVENPMTEALRRELSKMLYRYDEARRHAQDRLQQAKADDALFLQRFADLRRGVVRPVFEAVGAILQERGHGFSISEEDYAVNASGRSTEARIAIHILPAGMETSLHANDPMLSLSITTRHYNKTVSIIGGEAAVPGGLAGSRGAYEVAQIDTELVEGELLKLVAGILKG